MDPLPWRRRLFISDLDGTILLPDKTLGRRTRRTLEHFIDGGGLFTIATGRSAGSAAGTLAGLRLSTEAITHNGALTADLTTGVASDVVSMTGPLAAGLFERARIAGLGPMTYALSGDRTVIFHSPELNHSSASYLASVNQAHPASEDDGGALGPLRVLSMIILDTPERLEAFFAAECQDNPLLVCSLGHSAYTPGLGVGEVQAAGADKALAAIRLAGKLGLRPQDMVAFGDNMNDLPLLRAAGAGYCPPASAGEVLAEVKGRIASPEEEGVAAFLEQILEDGQPE